jgi:UDP-GlcNAc3NAcA epimerase
MEKKPKSNYLPTDHRQENTDYPTPRKAKIEAYEEIGSKEQPVVVPLHPRTQIALRSGALGDDAWGQKDADQLTQTAGNGHIRIIPPLSFLDMIILEKNARIILTDSGGVQKEAYWHCVPCVTLRACMKTVHLADNRPYGQNCICHGSHG